VIGLIVSMEIKIKNQLQMGGGNVDMWHDHMYVHYIQLQHNCCFSGTFTTILK